MLIDAAAIVAILARRPDGDPMLARLETAPPPHLVTPVSLLAAIEALARAKAPDGVATPALLARAGEAVAAFAAALGLREVPVTAELGRRAAGILAAGGLEAEACLAEAAARTYRTTRLGAEAGSRG